MPERTEIVKPRDLFAQIDNEAFKKELARALPNTLKPDRMVRLALTMLKKNSALLKCDPVSIMACVVECAQLGLEPEGVLGHAYIVPFGGTATLIVGYRGFMHLMYQSGSVIEVSAEIVRKGDDFSRTLGTRRELVHIPKPIPEKDDEKNWIAAYAVATLIGGHSAFELLERNQIHQARARSKSYQMHLKEGKASPWITDAPEMWKKTPIRRLSKRMPTSTTDKRAELLRAAMLDEYGERPGLLRPTLSGFEVVPTEDVPEGNPIHPTIEVSDSSASDEGEKPEEPFITTAEQTQIYNVAAQSGWQVPDEVKKYLQKAFKIDTVRLVRKSQLGKILDDLKNGA